jgi:pyruvate/2-oxoglutarate dehydrogenase complex dihydrolipoamide dehydrogenase (E3) component
VAALDLIVIGAGMAGMNAAGRASEAGARVAVIERDRVGGTCPIRGCIPSKALIRSAEVAHEVRTAVRYGVRVDSFSVDMGAVVDRVQGIIDAGEAGARGWLESLPGVRLVAGEARFRGPGEVEVDGEVLRAPRVVIAAGAEPALVQVAGLGDVPVLTSTDALALRELPERLLVIGAGPVGLELGQAYSRLGSRVTLVEIAPRLLIKDEEEIAAVLRERLEGEGVEILTAAAIERAENRPGGGVRLVVTHEGATRVLDGDALLLGAGRASSVESLRLAEAGIEGSPAGIPVDARLQSSREGHFAAGDVLGPPFGPYTHTARALGRSAAENALGVDAHDVSPDFGPRAIFTDPEVVTIGMTEEQARADGHDVGVGTSGFTGGKGRSWGREDGLAKAVVDRASRRILGAHVVAYHAADLIHPVVVAVRAGSADPLLDAFHIHPTFGERVRDAVRAALF